MVKQNLVLFGNIGFWQGADQLLVLAKSRISLMLVIGRGV